MSESAFQFTDRYQAAGIPYPNSETMCQGPCEGMGVVPCREDDPDPILRARWQDAEHTATNQLDRARAFARGEPYDPTHFVRCPDCNGTGQRAVS